MAEEPIHVKVTADFLRDPQSYSILNNWDSPTRIKATADRFWHICDARGHNIPGSPRRRAFRKYYVKSPVHVKLLINKALNSNTNDPRRIELDRYQLLARHYRPEQIVEQKFLRGLAALPYEQVVGLTELAMDEDESHIEDAGAEEIPTVEGSAGGPQNDEHQADKSRLSHTGKQQRRAKHLRRLAKRERETFQQQLEDAVTARMQEINQPGERRERSKIKKKKTRGKKRSNRSKGSRQTDATAIQTVVYEPANDATAGPMESHHPPSSHSGDEAFNTADEGAEDEVHDDVEDSSDSTPTTAPIEYPILPPVNRVHEGEEREDSLHRALPYSESQSEFQQQLHRAGFSKPDDSQRLTARDEDWSENDNDERASSSGQDEVLEDDGGVELPVELEADDKEIEESIESHTHDDRESDGTHPDMSKHQDPTLHGEENDQEDQEEEYIPTSAQPPSRHQEEPIIRPPSPSVVIYSPSLSPDDRHIRSSPIRSHGNNTSSGLRSALANPLQPRRSSTTPRKSVRFTGATSHFFTPPSPSPVKKPRSPAGTVSSLPFPPTTQEKFGLIQEQLAHEPFNLLIAVIFCNKTTGVSAIRIYHDLKAKYPTIQDLADANQEDVVEVIRTLGLQNHRAKNLIAIAQQWLVDPSAKGRRHRTLHYPYNGAGKDIKPREILEDDDEREGAWEIAHLPGVGDYAIDSWRIFCRDVLRGVATGYDGEGADAREHFEPEWMRVKPADKELKAFVRWMWLKEGFVYNALTGEKERASEEILEQAKHSATVVEDELHPDEEEAPPPSPSPTMCEPNRRFEPVVIIESPSESPAAAHPRSPSPDPSPPPSTQVGSKRKRRSDDEDTATNSTQQQKREDVDLEPSAPSQTERKHKHRRRKEVQVRNPNEQELANFREKYGIEWEGSLELDIGQLQELERAQRERRRERRRERKEREVFASQVVRVWDHEE